MRRTFRGATALVAAGFLLLSACGNGDDGPEPPDTDGVDAGADGDVDDATEGDDADDDGTDEAELSGELIVFAAASLTDAFEELGDTFTTTHPDVDVVFNFASSSTLATQLTEGAPADVFASANNTQMQVADDEDLVEEQQLLLTNVLEIVVEEGNPLGIETLDDLARDDVVLVLAAPEVPAGDFAAQMLDAAGIEVSPSSLEVDVRATLSRVELGEADAAIVYRSDVVTASDTVEGVEIPEDQNVIAEYPIATVTGGPNPDAAAAWIAFVTSSEGQAVLEEAGFTPAASS